MCTYFMCSSIWLNNLSFIWTYLLCGTVLGFSYIVHNLYNNSLKVRIIILFYLPES